MRRKHIRIAAMVIMGVLVLAMQGCDLASVLGVEEEEEKGPVKSDEAKITKYEIEAGINPELSETETGVITGTKIALELPYDVVDASVLLEPSIVVSEGADYVPRGEQTYDSKIFYTVEAENGDTVVYEVEAVVDPSTLP